MIAETRVSSQFPLVSVVVATYNGERFLKEQLDSIVCQTYPNLEIIIVDDASKDGTVAILDQFESLFPHIQVYKSEQNQGYIRNFERGMLLCKGDYIALSDQDDIWLHEKISFLMDQREDHGLVYCNSELIDAEGKSMGLDLSDVKRLTDFWSPLNYVTGGSAPGHAMILKREVVLACFPFPLIFPHDYWLGFVSTFSGPMKYVDTVLVLYRQHGGNVVGVNAGSAKAAKKRKITKQERNERIRQRMKLMYEKCPDEMTEIKKVFHSLNRCCQNFSLINNFTRMMIFLTYNEEITAYKKRNKLRRWLFGLKMFFKIE